MPDLQPGREEELHRLRRWLAFSERLDQLIEVSEPPVASDAGDPALSARHPDNAGCGTCPTRYWRFREHAAMRTSSRLTREEKSLSFSI